MTWYDANSWPTKLLEASPFAILITILAVIGLPILLHSIFYQQQAPKSLPKFVVLGPSGSGKTSLITNFDRGTTAETHTTIATSIIEVQLPASSKPASSRYRSENDFESRVPKKLILEDTPGHAKLRSAATASLSRATSLTGVLFVVDAADLSATADGGDGQSGLRDTASYLHDVLLKLQQQFVKAKSSKHKSVPVLIAANKTDLFTSLPIHVLQKELEREITQLRNTRSHGIASVGKAGKGEGLDAGGADDEGDDDVQVLAGDTSSNFEFASMAEWGVDVDVLGGSVAGSEQPETDRWWDWIAELL